MRITGSIPVKEVQKSIKDILPLLPHDITSLISDKLALPEEYIAQLLSDYQKRAFKKLGGISSLETAKKIYDYCYELLIREEHNFAEYALDKIKIGQKMFLFREWRALEKENPSYRALSLYYCPTAYWSDDDVNWVERAASSFSLIDAILQHPLKAKAMIKTHSFLTADMLHASEVPYYHMNFSSENFTASNAQTAMNFRRANLRGTKWMHTTLGDHVGALIGPPENSYTVIFNDVDLTEASFTGAKFSNVRFVNALIGKGMTITTNNKGEHVVTCEKVILGNYYFCYSTLPAIEDKQISQEIIRLVRNNSNPIFLPLVNDIKFTRHEGYSLKLHADPSKRIFQKSINACYLMGAKTVNEFNERLNKIFSLSGGTLFSDKVLDEVVKNIERTQLKMKRLF